MATLRLNALVLAGAHRTILCQAIASG